MTLRIASYNLRALQDDVAALARTVRAIDPDVLCVQEVPRIPPAGIRIADFAARCGLTWSGRETRVGQTSVLVSPRVQVLATHHIRLPAARGDRRNVAIAVVAEFGGQPVSVASVHLSLQEQMRVVETEKVLAALAAVPGPAVVAGDLNEEGDGKARHLFERSMRVISPMTPTFPAGRPERVLDVILATPDVQPQPHVDVPWDFDDLRAASDHRPTWVDVTV